MKMTPELPAGTKVFIPVPNPASMSGGKVVKWNHFTMPGTIQPRHSGTIGPNGRWLEPVMLFPYTRDPHGMYLVRIDPPHDTIHVFARDKDFVKL
jgi:hypothetical protein